jgi:hypothetical protein
MLVGKQYRHTDGAVWTVLDFDCIRLEVTMAGPDGYSAKYKCTYIQRYFVEIPDTPRPELAVGQRWESPDKSDIYTVTAVDDWTVYFTVNGGQERRAGIDWFLYNCTLFDTEPGFTVSVPLLQPEPVVDCTCSLAELMEGNWSSDCPHHATSPAPYVGRTGLGIPRPKPESGDLNQFTRAEVNAACAEKKYQSIYAVESTFGEWERV